ncbi:MAG: hypothetical protein DI568_00120 [Sphingomonas sp.]|nr:MAG: hypothetical protein DI568_00120 [Sphingomonas sp.]
MRARTTAPVRRAGAACVIGILALANAPAHGQAPRAEDDRAAEHARDAFGIRIGAEQIGLYNESQVRGFSLQDAGNYRFNDSYFVRSAGVVDSVVSSVVTRVGYNALEADFAAPSGIVTFRLRSPFEAPRLHTEVALRDYGGQFLDIRLAQTSVDSRLAGLVGGQMLRARTSSGLAPNYYRFGSVVEWRPANGIKTIGFASLNIFDLEGTYGVSLRGNALPPPMRHPQRYVPGWSDHDGADLNLGLLTSAAVGGGVELSGSLVHSRLNLKEADFTQFIVDGSGVGRAVTISNRPRVNQSWSASAGASWRAAPNQRLYAELRGRQTRNRFAPAVSVEVGSVDLAYPLPPVAEPDLTPAPSTLDSIDQLSAGVGYEGTFGRLRLKGGVQKSRHRRHIDAPERPTQAATQIPWLYDASIAFAAGRRLTLFASATRGLEESGAAPETAANRYELLPPAIATQQELGFRGGLTEGLALIGSLFSIRKPAPGFDANNHFGLSGELRHRGAELSLVGALAPRLRIVSGAVLLDATRSGEPVKTGAWSREAVGVARFQSMAGLTYSVPGLEGLSLDGQLNHATSRRVRSSGDLRTPPLTTTDIGLRHAFRLGAFDAAVRARLLNLFDADGWIASRSEQLDRPSRRAFRLSLTLSH